MLKGFISRSVRPCWSFRRVNPAIFKPSIRYFHPQLEPMVPHLNQSLIDLAKSKFESKMPDKLFDLLKEKLFVYYSCEERLDTELSVEDRRRIANQKSGLEQYVHGFEDYCKTLIELKETIEMQKLVKEAEEKEALVELEADLVQSIQDKEIDLFREFLKPSVSKDTSIILEIRAGAGGAEAAIFVKELATMYEQYSDRNGWKFEVMDVSIAGNFGGYKEITAGISGGSESDTLGIFGSLQFETGTHRVQRVPATESAGRLHTSTVTVAVLPEMKDVDVNLRQQDIRVDIYRASGPGGQHVNTTDSAVRLTHLPTGIVVAIQDERSQHKNKDKAMRILRAKIYEKEKRKLVQQRREMRQQQIGSGDRSEKIRTYNFPQNRITDHRINLSLFGIEKMMAGELCGEFAQNLLEHQEKEQLENLLDDPSAFGW